MKRPHIPNVHEIWKMNTVRQPQITKKNDGMYVCVEGKTLPFDAVIRRSRHGLKKGERKVWFVWCGIQRKNNKQIKEEGDEKQVLMKKTVFGICQKNQ